MFPIEELVQQILLWAVTGVLGVLAGWTVSTVKHGRGEDKALKEGVLALLQSDIFELHHRCVKRGSATTREKQQMDHLYKSYHELGGNGTGTQLYHEFMELPTVEEE